MFVEKWDIFDNQSKTRLSSEAVTHLLMSFLKLSHCKENTLYSES